MKPLIAASMIAAAVAASGCAPLDGSVFVEGASVLDQSCSANSSVELIRGSLDLGPSNAAGVLPVYFGHFGLRSDLEPIVLQTGDDILASDSRNEFIADTVRISYKLNTAGTTVAEAQEPIYFVIKPATADGFIQFQMLTTAAATAISNAIGAGGDDTLVITFNFEGNVRAGANSLLKMSTPKVFFPVRVVNRTPVLPTCTAPQAPTLVGPCGNAQESFSYDCQ